MDHAKADEYLTAECYFKAKISNIQLTWAVDEQRAHWAEGTSNTTEIDQDVITG
ncbi:MULTISPECIES: hypothetical protein [unclassified Mucilaginibacter]|uniref:hypothetical protein n=1 Tax=unclassified Mucilaginibacter TaxID=2617802 RepID=UPI002AC9AFB9|nr:MULTISPECIES: hypothetical protein [unclassified Mucilaginibacter]MEB0278075.1 hypothetical protein [Mucilaginibacter sp. 10B2]MEB0302938.1 hypothetical protein [Mucilaginibacter sp. 5C4]WPX22986.1 hypothetical protein RHM67_17030 [Mucilaginibacter sp. 5C4]